MGVCTRVDSKRTTTPKTVGDSNSRLRWQHWEDTLRKLELQDLAAWLLEAASPLALISSQLLYMGTPWLGSEAHDLARLLESGEDRLEFVQSLRSDAVDTQEPAPGAKA